MVNFDMHKVRKMTINCEPIQVCKMTKLLKVRKMTSLKIYISPSIKKLETFKFAQQVNLIQKVPLSTPPQEVVTSLPHNYMTLANLCISSYKNNFLMEVHRTLLHYG